MVQERAVPTRSISFLTIISIFILFSIILATGGLYLYKINLTKNITQMENDLNLAKNRFEPSKITELQVLDKRLRASTEILSKHTVVTPIFQALQSLTMKTVRYTKFSYDLGTDGKITVQMSGLAIGYSSVALQSDLFTTRDEGKNFIDPIFSNLTLDEKGISSEEPAISLLMKAPP